MDTKYNRNLVSYSQELRKNMTKEERKLWYDFLKNYPSQFNRQKIIGKYIADFYCAEAQVVIELDGSQHYNTEDAMVKDAERTKYIESYGITVIRVQNIDVNRNFKGVCETLDMYIKQGIEKQKTKKNKNT